MSIWPKAAHRHQQMGFSEELIYLVQVYGAILSEVLFFYLEFSLTFNIKTPCVKCLLYI